MRYLHFCYMNLKLGPTIGKTRKVRLSAEALLGLAHSLKKRTKEAVK